MKKQLGFAPLLIPILIVLVGATGFTAYKVSDSVNEGQFSFAKFFGNEQPQAEQAVNLDCPQPNTWSYELTQAKINEYLNKGFEFRDYKIEGGEVVLGDDSLTAEIELSDNRKLTTQLTLIEHGTDIRVDGLRSTGGTEISRTELALLRAMLNNADKLIWQYAPQEYRRMFRNVSISDDSMITVNFYTSEYLECVNQ